MQVVQPVPVASPRSFHFSEEAGAIQAVDVI